MIEFYLILAAIGLASAGMFWRLLIGTMVMLVAGFMGEAGYINSMVGFVIGMLGWFYILYEIFAGDAGKQAGQASPEEAVQSAFGNMRLVVTIGWAIYPLGYVLGYFVMVDASGCATTAASSGGSETLNVVYNLALVWPDDIVNKLAFCLLVWYAATSDNKHSNRVQSSLRP